MSLELPPHSSRTQARSPEAILPLETWEHIAAFVFPDRDLLLLAAVCKTFGALYAGMYLRRHGFTEEVLEASELQISAPVLLALSLHLNFHVLRARRLVCNLEIRAMECQLNNLKNIITKADGLRELSVAFDQDLFAVPLLARGAATNALCSMLSDFARRGQGTRTVFVIHGQTMFSCRTEDVAHWKSDYYQPSPYTPYIRLRLCTTTSATSAGYIETRNHTGGIDPVDSVDYLRSATMQLIDEFHVPWSVAVLTFNSSDITHFTLKSSPKDQLSLYLSSIIKHIEFPEIVALSIETHSIDPAALRIFFLRHPSIARLKYRVHNGTSDEGLHATSLLIDPPIAHPWLISIDIVADGGRPWAPLLPGIIGSPKLHELCFSFGGYNSSSAANSLLRDLRFIAQRGSAVILCLVVREQPRKPSRWWNLIGSTWSMAGTRSVTEFWAHSDEAQDVARLLSCVSNLHVTVWSVETARRMLPWIALLPAVVHVYFTLHIRFQPGRRKLSSTELIKEASRFREEARIVLHGVSGISCTAS